jgi:hypothetical protein
MTAVDGPYQHRLSPPLIRLFCSRSENHHQRSTPFVQTARGSHDVNHFLSDGVRIIRLASVQRGAAQQVRP